MLKKMIRKSINKFGYDIRNINIDAYKSPINPFNLLKYVVHYHIKQNPNFFVLQIGAHDGVRNDPIRPLIKNYHLKGLLVEPMTDFYNELKLNYKSESQIMLENSAISHKDGIISLYRFRRDAPVPHQFFHGLARFDKEYILNRAKKNGLEEYIEELYVPALTFNSLLKKYHIENINLLQIDTEGFDYEILKMAFSSNIFPEIINYEWSELSLLERYECKNMLIRNNYKYVDVGADTVCILDN